jgi:UDP-glucose 6-dehydrogenase
MSADKRIGRTHLDAVHKGGRGAGGHCFIKDMAAFAEMYRIQSGIDDPTGIVLLDKLQIKNIENY